MDLDALVETTFAELDVGAQFHMCAYGEAGTIASLGIPGARVFIKRGPVTYEQQDTGERRRIGLTSCRVWHDPVEDFGGCE